MSEDIMSEDSSGQHPNKGVTTVGRTPWDFATEVLRRLGPSMVVVVLLGIGSYYFFHEINLARERADNARNDQIKLSNEEQKDLRKSLVSAQSLLIENTSKMQIMSQQLISNITDMMEVQNNMDDQVLEKRSRVIELQAEVDSIQEEISNLKAKLQTEITKFPAYPVNADTPNI